MDPDQTLRELLESLKQRHWNDVEASAENLLAWLHKRGFPPKTLGAKALGSSWHRAVAEFVCLAALSKVREIRARRKKGGAR
jgi:hypothetical protein